MRTVELVSTVATVVGTIATVVSLYVRKRRRAQHPDGAA